MGEIEESIWDDYRGRYNIARGDGEPQSFRSYTVSSLIDRKRETREAASSNWSRSWAATAAAVHLAQSIYITAAPVDGDLCTLSAAAVVVVVVSVYISIVDYITRSPST